jgi:carbon starvation protein CstA
MLFTLLTYNDANFAFYILSTALFTHGADENHWKTFIPISLFMTVYAFKIPDSIPFLLLVLTFFIIIMNAEHRAIPEEASNKKLYSRILFLIVFSFAYFGPLLPFLESIFGNIDYLRKIFGLFIGTLILSIGVQVYLLYFKASLEGLREVSYDGQTSQVQKEQRP